MATANEIAAIDRVFKKRVDAIQNYQAQGRTAMAECVIGTGRELAAVKEEIPHGEFMPWIERNFQWSHDTANNYMRAFERFGKFRNVSLFDASAMYLLAKCEPAVQEAKRLTDQGFVVSHEKAKELIAKSAKPARGNTKARVSPGAQPAPASAASFKCPNCGGTEADEDGDCAGCHEPVGTRSGREPGDDTEAIEADKKSRSSSGKERFTRKDAQQAAKALQLLTGMADKLGLQKQWRPYLERMLSDVKAAGK